MALKNMLSAGQSAGRHLIEKTEHVLIAGVLVAACIVAVKHGFEKGSDVWMKAVFAMVLVVCRVVYVVEWVFVRYVRRVPRDPWPAIEETKAW